MKACLVFPPFWFRRAGGSGTSQLQLATPEQRPVVLAVQCSPSWSWCILT